MKAIIVSLLVVLVGCASTNESAETPASETESSSSSLAATDTGAEKVQTKSQLVCTYEVPTGSHRSKRVCRTVAQKEASQKEAQDRVRRDSYRSTGGTVSN